MFIVCLIALACFGIGAGMFIGAGNRGGVLCALVCGAVTGFLLNLPFLLDGDRLSNAVLFVSAVAGALLIKFVAEEHALKRYFRGQKRLIVNLGPNYSIGSDKD